MNLGLAYFFLGDLEEALNYSRRGLTLVRDIGNREFEANALNNLGMIYSNIEEYELAIDYYHFSLELKLKIQDIQGAAGTLINIGDTYRKMNENEQAVYYLQRGIEAAQESQHHEFEANGWFSLALTLKHLHQYSPDAITAYDRACTIYQKMEMLDRVGVCKEEITEIQDKSF